MKDERTGRDYLGSVEKLQRFRRKIVHWYHDGDCDLLLTATLRVPPVKLGSFHLAGQLEEARPWARRKPAIRSDNKE